MYRLWRIHGMSIVNELFSSRHLYIWTALSPQGCIPVVTALTSLCACTCYAQFGKKRKMSTIVFYQDVPPLILLTCEFPPTESHEATAQVFTLYKYNSFIVSMNYYVHATSILYCITCTSQFGRGHIPHIGNISN